MRFLSGRAVTLSHVFLDDETPMVVPSVSVTVKDASGATVYTGSATSSGTTWTASLPAQPEGVYTVSWQAGTTATDADRFEVVGGYLFTIPEARGSDMDLADGTRFPAAEVKHYREVVEEEFETITGRSFTPRVKRLDFLGDGTQSYIAPLFDITELKSGTGPDGALSLSGWVVSPSGMLQAPFELVEGQAYTLTVSYGFPFTPDDVKRAGLLRLRSLLTAERSGIPDRATAFVAAEGGNFTLATAGRNGYETGIPEVDAVLNRYKYRVFNDVFGVR